MTRKMKDSGIEWIGEIPEEWEVVKLKYISEFYNGFSFDSNDLISDYTYPVIRIGDIDKEIVDLNSKLGIKENLGLSPYLIKDKDILLAMSGATVGKVGFVEKSGESYINQRVGIIRSSNPYFVFYNLLTNNFLEYINIRADGSAQPNISTKMIENFSIAYPKDGKTQKITNEIKRKINSINNTINVIYNQLENLENYKKSLITEAVTKGLDKNVEMKDSGIEWIGEIPKHWEVVKGKYILNLLKRLVRDTDEVITCFRDGEVTLRSNRREDGFTFSDKEIGYQGINAGDLVVHCMDGFAGAIGISDSRGKGSPVLNVIDSSENKKYLMYYLRIMAYSDVFIALATGIRVRSVDLRWNKLANLFYPLPRNNEQNDIVEYLDKKTKLIDDSIAIKQKQLETLEEYKKSLIYEYVTGKKEVNDGEET
ncbi:restriction endonuclease subunit S [Finegoldia magna]|uniref:restriction endonuclease subunit S n=1 Tax=Finegoldia magna TaxID=1260 RepID=UPI00288A46E3|nr:restriction endonuclease subunit S [Finegoldia magna]